MGYIIIGDSKKYGFKDCLVRVLLTDNQETAKEMLRKYQEAGYDRNQYSNIRLQETESNEEWWNDMILAN